MILRRLLYLMRPQAWWMVLAILLSAIATGAHIALMATSGWFITSMALAGLVGGFINYFTPAALIRAFAMTRTASRYAERVIGHEATLRIVAGLRPWLFSRIERAAPANLGDFKVADLLTRLRADIDRVELAFLRVLSPILAGLIVLVPAMIWLVFKLPAFALVLSMLLGVVGVLFPLLLMAMSKPASDSLVRGTAQLNTAFVETVEGQAELAIYDPTGNHRHRVLARSQSLFLEEDKLARAQALGAMAIPLAAHMGMVALLVLGIPAMQAGQIAPAELPMLMLMGIALFDALAGWPLALQSLPVLIASARRVFDLANREAILPEPAAPLTLNSPLSILLRDVSFHYAGQERLTLNHITLSLEPGQRIAILGASGSGKSTLAALIMRFLPAKSGAIQANAHDYAMVSGEKLRQRLALLGQHDHLFSGTIRDNLLLADPDASQAALERACRTAQILPFIQSQPDGFETWVGAHGKALSGGEGRRLLLARALLRRPDILILDEPTEGLDPATENAVIAAIIADHPEAGIMLLTHRNAGLEQMDMVFTLQSGQLVAASPPMLAIQRNPSHDA